ncbi:UBX domain-containing 7 [Gossypium arboreum]|uniref:UBX domain-containing 7 n=1 Tax=Gossypium arboreum TaxID=29729 RepID=A0A0B0PTI0_GOSAR|nr:UBX domain-containing 7 [Gossypium arboreum]
MDYCGIYYVLLKLNLDTWGNEAVSQTISTNLILAGAAASSEPRYILSEDLYIFMPLDSVYDDSGKGRKICTYYRLDWIPVVLIVDPITGQHALLAWSGST